MRQVEAPRSEVTSTADERPKQPPMSVQLTTPDERIESNRDTRLPANLPALLAWLDEQPNFVTVERTRIVRSKDSGTAVRYGTRERTVSEAFWLNPEYEVDTRACYDTQRGVCDAWTEMQFPAHRVETVDRVEGAYLYTWGSTSQPRGRLGRIRRDSDSDPAINYEAVQHPDGHGVIRHYDTLAAVRTKTGLVLTNEQDYGSGFAKVTQPEDADHDLPLSGVKSVLDDQTETVCDIASVVREQTRIRYTTRVDPIGGHQVVTGVREARDNDRQVTRLNLTTGAAVILLHDSTANNPEEEKCGFYLSPKEAEVYDGAQGALDALQPIDVLQAREQGLEVVPSDKFAGNGAGGFYDENLLGDCVIRQGEWYLVPMPDDWMPDAPIYKPMPKARRKTSWELGHLDVTDHLGEVDAVEDAIPTRCECGSTSHIVEADMPAAMCEDCGLWTWYGDEDDLEALFDRAMYEDALDALDSHRPRDLAVTDDGIFVRGSFRHVDNEHRMLNVKERWHLVAENTRDVTVFDLGADTNGVARWE